MLLQPKAHFVIVDQFAPVGLRDAFADSAVALLYAAQGGIFHKMFGAHAGREAARWARLVSRAV